MLRTNEVTGKMFDDLSVADNSVPFVLETGKKALMTASQRRGMRTKHDGTVYAHGMLGTNLLTNKRIRLIKHGQNDIRIHFAPNVDRQSGHDYAPIVKRSHGRLPYADQGTADNPLNDPNTQAKVTKYYRNNICTGYDDFSGKVSDILAKFTVEQNAITPYVLQALRLRISGSEQKIVTRYIADLLVDHFWGDTLSIEIDLPETKQRSKNGELTQDDKNRIAKIKETENWLASEIAPKIVAYAYSIKPE